jgi:haloacetate dehalogenase
MADLADLFPGFESHYIDTPAGKLFARSGGDGPPLLLIHGFPQTHVEYHRIAPALAKKFRLILPDLPGYGWSEIPEAGPDHAPYTKRAMGNALIELMEKLGHVHFGVIGHDRGGRVGYRMALDHPGRVSKLCVLDIIPTLDMWKGMNALRSMIVYHWPFLAQRHPLPEMLISKAPIEYLEWTLGSWSPDGLKKFDPQALDHYRAFFADPKRIHACCEDYRAGQSTDVKFDEEDFKAGKKISCPTLALWGKWGIPASGTDPIAIWQPWTTKLEGRAIECGHFLPEEKPRETEEALLEFFARA